MPSWFHPCRGKKRKDGKYPPRESWPLVEVHGAEECPVCKMAGKGGTPGPVHVCGKDISTCEKCNPMSEDIP